MVTDQTDAVVAVVARAIRAGNEFAAAPREHRALALEAMAAELDAHRTELVAIATMETHFSTEILVSELQRTIDQLRFFGDVLRDGAYLELATDSDRSTVEVHRILVPIGVAAIFGSSNFPLAYGVAGGDAASALAAGCAIVVKEHPSHPRTCQSVLARLRAALESTGFDPNTVSMVAGFEAGVELVTTLGVNAVGFTGSTQGGKALYDLASNRTVPIPFYGELGSLNPVVVTSTAAHDRAIEVGTLLAKSVLQRAGQMCTKPGIVFVSEGTDGDDVVQAMASVIDAGPQTLLLNNTVQNQFIAGSHDLAALPGVRLRAGEKAAHDAQDGAVHPVLFEANTSDFTHGELLTEVFGPVSLVLRYASPGDVSRLLRTLEPALVGGIHASIIDDPDSAEFMRAIMPGVGRLVWNGPTTGLAVGWATHHGGSYPASTSAHSSVGATAIRRWLRPVAFQGVPTELLPHDIREASTRVPIRRVNGILLTS